MQEHIFPIKTGKRLTDEEFAQKYWEGGKLDKVNQYIWMDIDEGRDEHEQVFINNIWALMLISVNDWKDMQKWVLEQIQILAEETADRNEDFLRCKTTQKPAKGQSAKEVKRSKAPVDASLFERHPLVFTLLGVLIGFVLRLLFEFLHGV